MIDSAPQIVRARPIWGTLVVVKCGTHTILETQIWFLVGDFGLGNQNVSALRGRGFGMIGLGWGGADEFIATNSFIATRCVDCYECY